MKLNAYLRLKAVFGIFNLRTITIYKRIQFAATGKCGDQPTILTIYQKYARTTSGRHLVSQHKTI